MRYQNILSETLHVFAGHWLQEDHPPDIVAFGVYGTEEGQKHITFLIIL